MARHGLSVCIDVHYMLITSLDQSLRVPRPACPGTALCVSSHQLVTGGPLVSLASSRHYR